MGIKTSEEALDAFQKLFMALDDNRISSVRHLDHVVWNYLSNKNRRKK